ncbi:MAG TPA: CHRD domain-containing protein [Alphaproteobacteria bacterium]|nr:CHRD domain-containing protein [Alphaproteobacteria bacterium]
MSKSLKLAAALVAAAVLAGCAQTAEQKPAAPAAAAQPAGQKFTAQLSGAQEVPPVPGSAAGSADVTYNPSTKILTWKVSMTGLSGEAQAAHFHGPAGPGQNAGVMLPLAPKGMKLGNPIQGSAELKDDVAKALQAGQLYINIHTAANPNGELRGQVVPAK